MANHHRHLAALLLTFLLLVSSSSARLLMIGFGSLNKNVIELPTDNIVNGPEKIKAPPHAMPCHMEAATAGRSKYGPLVLNMLPKYVPIPPSGPSGKIHDDPN
ncbi:hypothetical protein L6164_030184 [Bauhinia variegata]|uniref:Uncharacterized protein n=1 Tax=Bauhinia variegata TaxID=167791 RepID=A0ACB9LBD5_BAUVA|nr:hypothetical protein L6164_030184 [Bauhinia variegata]